tara:strand:+ start:82 stop:282 length:201 start_codon:yes stop_codon:yes gene_type:complete
MIKITIETDDRIVGYKDKNAFDVMDCLQIIQQCVGDMFELSDKTELILTEKQTFEPTKDRVIAEGM